MRGTVKWFSEEKGYGFIVGDDTAEYHVSVRDVSGATLPANRDTVEFTPATGNRGPRATNVTIVQAAAKHALAAARSDDRVTCGSCQKRMVPRMITYRGEPQKSVCPFCGTTYRKFGWCFIATAVYGDYDAPKVQSLRAFRDDVLGRTELGRHAIATYYRISPPIAAHLQAHPLSATIVRAILDVLIRIGGWWRQKTTHAGSRRHR